MQIRTHGAMDEAIEAGQQMMDNRSFADAMASVEIRETEDGYSAALVGLRDERPDGKLLGYVRTGFRNVEEVQAEVERDMGRA